MHQKKQDPRSKLLMYSLQEPCDNIDIPTKCYDLLEKIACDTVTQIRNVLHVHL